MTAGLRTNFGRNLNREWNIGAIHALYHKDGKWFNRLEDFPGALCDPDGYKLFKTEQEYLVCSQLRIGQQTNVNGTIKDIPGYVRMRR